MQGIYFTLPIFLIGLILLLYFVPLGLWIQSGVSIGWGKIGMIKLVIMRIRKIPPKLVTEGIINLHRAGLDFVTSEELETHYLASGNVPKVVNALIAADKANIELDYKTATAIDLAGRDVQEAVQTSVYPKVIDCPTDGKVSAVAKDGIELKAKARVTVRTNIAQLVGGATDDTIIARVGQGIVSAIGSSDTYKIVLENPDEISRKVLAGRMGKRTKKREPKLLYLPLCLPKGILLTGLAVLDILCAAAKSVGSISRRAQQAL